MNAHELKQKQVRISKLNAEIDEANETVRLMQKELQHKRNTAEALQQQIDDYLESQKGPVITEHAYLRYFERVEQRDLDEVAERILPDNVKMLIKELGDGKYPVNGFKITVKNNTVITLT